MNCLHNARMMRGFAIFDVVFVNKLLKNLDFASDKLEHIYIGSLGVVGYSTPNFLKHLISFLVNIEIIAPKEPVSLHGDHVEHFN